MSDFVRNINEANFSEEVLDSEIPVLIDFWAPRCAPCGVLGSVVELLAEKYDGKIKFVKVNVDENLKLAKQYQIAGIPNIKIMKKQEILHDIVGVKHPDEYEKILDGVL